MLLFFIWIYSKSYNCWFIFREHIGNDSLCYLKKTSKLFQLLLQSNSICACWQNCSVVPEPMIVWLSYIYSESYVTHSLGETSFPNLSSLCSSLTCFLFNCFLFSSSFLCLYCNPQSWKRQMLCSYEKYYTYQDSLTMWYQKLLCINNLIILSLALIVTGSILIWTLVTALLVVMQNSTGHMIGRH